MKLKAWLLVRRPAATAIAKKTPRMNTEPIANASPSIAVFQVRRGS